MAFEFDPTTARPEGEAAPQFDPTTATPAKEATLGERVSFGARRMVNSARTTLTDDPNKIAQIAADQAKASPAQSAASRQMQEEIKPYADAANNATGVVDTVKTWGALGAKRAGQLISNPGETVKMIAEQLPNSVPGLAGAVAGAKAGAMAGTAVAPGVGTAIGAVGGGVLGGLAGGYLTEKGASVQEQVQTKAAERGIDLQDQQAVAGVFRSNQAEIDKAATLKAVGTAGTDAVLNVLTAGLSGMGRRILGNEVAAMAEAVKAGRVSTAEAVKQLGALEARAVAQSALPATIARGAAVTGAEMLGEGVSEAVGQKLAYGKVDAGDVVDESLLGLGQGVAMAGASSAVNRIAGTPDRDQIQQNIVSLRERLQVGQDAAPAQGAAADPLMLPNTQPDRLYVFPDGTVGRTGEVESYLANLPEDQRADARARFMGRSYTEVNDPQAQQARRWWENYGDGQPAQRSPDYLGEVQAAVRSGTPFTTQQTVETVRSAMEDAWLAQNITPNAPAAAESAEVVGEQLQGEFEQVGGDTALAAVDARVRTGRVLSGLQNILDAGADNTLQVLNRLSTSLTRIGEQPLNGEEAGRVRRIVDAYMGFRGVGEPAPLPTLAPPAMDQFADNASMEALIPERPSQAMGLDPNAGPISRAAVTAVDGGATQNLFRQAVERIRTEKANGKAQAQAQSTQSAQADAARDQASAPVGSDGSASTGLPGAGNPATASPGLTPASLPAPTQEAQTDGPQADQAQQATPEQRAPQPPATPGAALQSAMKTEDWTAEVDSPGNTIWVKRVGGEEYTARMTGTNSMEVTVLVNGVGTQIGSTSTTDPKAAAKAASKAVTDDVAESAAPAPSQQAQAPAEPQETTHNGTRIYRTRTKLGDEVKAMWAVETPENKARRAAGERTLGGDTLHDTIEQAKTAADREAKQYAERKAFAEQQDAEERARKEADEARKAGNRGKSIAERRKETVLDGQTKLPSSAGLGNTTRRNAMQMAVEQGRAVVERQVDDTAAKKRDQDAIDRVRSAGYMLGLSNENIPVVKAGLEAQARLKANDYKKPEYRVYASTEPTGGFFEITKIEYEYAQELMAQKVATPAPSPQAQVPAATEQTATQPNEIGRNNQPISEGGKPFKSRADADAAKKLQPLMRVKKVKGGFVLAEKTPAQIAAQAKAAKRLGSVGNTGPLAAHELLASLGGLSKSTMADLGFDRNVRVGARWLFSGAGGLTLERATEALQQYGYMDGTDQAQAISIIQRSAKGQPQYTAEGWDQVAKAEAETRYADHLAAQEEAAQEEDFDPFASLADDGYPIQDVEASGIDEAAPEVLTEVLSGIDHLEAIGQDLDSITERIALQYPEASQQEYHELVQAAINQAIEGAAQPEGRRDDGEVGSRQAPATEAGAGQDAAEGDLLTAPTRADIEAQQDRAEAAARQEASDRQRADQDAADARERAEVARRSQAAADTFELGQDPMANLTGQQDIFGGSQQEAEPAPQAKPSTARASQPKTEVIEDLGEKIGGARKDTARSTGTAIFSRPMDMETLQRMFKPLAPLSVTETQMAVADMVKGWKNGPRLRVVATPSELPSAAPSDTRGQYLNGTAYLVASNHRSAGNVQRTLAHEAIAHYGLRSMLGGVEWQRAMRNIQQGLERGDAALLELRDQVRGAYRDEAGNFNLSPAQEADEIAARAVEVGFDAKTGEFRTGFEWVKRAYSRIAQFLRSLGFDVRFTNAELQGMLARAQRYLAMPARAGESLVVGSSEPAAQLARDRATGLDTAIIGNALGAANAHPRYSEAKSGNLSAALDLARDLITPEVVAKVRAAIGDRRPLIVPVVAEEAAGRNKIPRAAAEVLAQQLGLETADNIGQANRPRRTGLDGLDRIFARVSFDGPVQAGQDYLLLDDTLTQGGTFAALASHIEASGGRVVGAFALTGKQYSAKIALSPDTLQALRDKHGSIEPDFQAATGYGFDALTESEARYLANFRPADALRIRVAAEGRRAGQSGNPPPAGPDGVDGAALARGAGQWDTPASTRFDNLVYKLQDKLIDTKRVQEAITATAGQIGDDLNVYLQEELFHGRAASRVKDFASQELKPLLTQMRTLGLQMADVEEFLHARHAREANALIAGREPGMPDGGSGMTNQAADDYFRNLDPGQRRRLEQVAGKVDAIIASTRQLYADYGLEDQATVDGWGQMFKSYVPLMREDKDGGMGVGQGFSIKGKEVKGRTGSTRKVVDILANVAAQRERVIVRGEKNRVARALVGLAQANPNPQFWEVRSQPPTERVYDAARDMVVERPDSMFKQRPNVITAKVRDSRGNVTEQAVVLNEDNPRAVRMAQALKNMDAGNLEGLLGASATITRYFAAINTQYNPVFGVVNLVRDVQAAMVNLAATPLAGQQRRIATDTAAALAAIYRDVRAARRGGRATSAWSTLWEQMQADGGTTGYRDLFRTSVDRAEQMQSILTPEGWMKTGWGRFITADGRLKVPAAMAQKQAGMLFDWLSDYNEAMENGVRLATYKAALDNGMSREQAASVSKNITVNFNRRGQVGLQAGALYAFFNAAMQGTARIGQTIFDMDNGNPKTLRLSSVGKKVVYGGVLLGSIQALMLAAAGFSDDDPPEFVRERSLIIPTGGKTYISIPMPLGLHVIPGLGRHATEFALSGFEKPAQRALAVVAMFADAFNPIGNAGLSIQTLAPTALDPLVALSENRDWTGKPIARVSSNKALPGHAQWKDTATTWSKLLAEGINYVSGGNEYVAGVLSPTPDQIDYLIAQLTGGVGREISKVEQSARSLITGEELPTYKVPLIGRLVGNADSQASQGNSFYANLNRLNELETEIKGLRKDGRSVDAARLTRERPEARLIQLANRTERRVQELRREKRALVEKGAGQDAVRAKDAQVTAEMVRLNLAVERAREPAR